MNIPTGFTTPLDLFESVITELIIIKYQNNDAIHIVSIGSRKLLRDLIIIAKFIKKIKQNASVKEEPEIILHAIDLMYENAIWMSGNGDCIPQFRELVNDLNLKVALQTYCSIDEYNLHKSDAIYPEIFLSIDFPLPYDVNFPVSSVTIDGTPLPFKYTEEGLLDYAKNKSINNSLHITLTDPKK